MMACEITMRELHVMLSHHLLDDQVYNAARHHLEWNRSRAEFSGSVSQWNLPPWDLWTSNLLDDVYTQSFEAYRRFGDQSRVGPCLRDLRLVDLPRSCCVLLCRALDGRGSSQGSCHEKIKDFRFTRACVTKLAMSEGRSESAVWQILERCVLVYAVRDYDEQHMLLS